MTKEKKESITPCLLIIAISIIFIFIMIAVGNVAIIIAVFLLVIPAIILLVAFTLAHYLVPTCALSIFLNGMIRNRLLKHGAAFTVVLGLSALLAWQANSELERTAAQLMADDKLTERVPIPKTIALQGSWYGSGDKCSGICLRLLLNGQVDRVIVGPFGRKRKPKRKPNSSTFRGKVYWLENGRPCDLKAIKQALGGGSDARDEGETISPRDMLYLRMASGTCLRWRDASLEEADALLMSYTVKAGQTNAFDAGYNIFAKTLDPKRLSYFIDPAGKRREVYRATHVRLEVHPFLLLPSFNGGFGLKMKPGFVRFEKDLGKGIISEKVFLTRILNMNLSLRRTDIINIQRELIQSALQNKRPVDDLIIDIAMRYIDELHQILLRVHQNKTSENRISWKDLKTVLDIMDNRKLSSRISYIKIGKIMKFSRNEKFSKAVIQKTIKAARKYMTAGNGSKLANAMTLLTHYVPNKLKDDYSNEVVSIYKEIMKSPCLTAQTFKFLWDMTSVQPMLKEDFIRSLARNRDRKIICETKEGKKDMKKEYLKVIMREICKMGKSAREALPLVKGIAIDKNDSDLLALKMTTLYRLGMDKEKVIDMHRQEIETAPHVKRNIQFIFYGEKQTCR